MYDLEGKENTGDLARHWRLDPAVTFLNHGSFGACPRPVLDRQTLLRARMEAEPMRFFLRDLDGMLAEARAALAAFVGADPDDLAFVNNTTTGVNAVVRSLSFAAGDELLVTSHAYNACRNALAYAAERAGARVVVVDLPFPIATAATATEAILARVGDRTRLALIDHVSSPTALVFPIHDIVKALQGRGVDVLVDGAHVPGMVPLDLRALGAAYYVANCHKWLCAPKGAAFLHVRPDRQAVVRPAVISHGANALPGGRSRFRREFDWVGTDDPTAFLCVPTALGFLDGLLPGGWPEIMRRNRALALQARDILCETLGVARPAPDDMIGSIAAVPLDGISYGRSERPRTILEPDPLQDELLTRFRIEVPIITLPAPPRRLIRISAQLYNDVEQYRRLAAALPSIERRG